MHYKISKFLSSFDPFPIILIMEEHHVLCHLNCIIVPNYRHLCVTQKHQKPILLRIQMQNVFLKLTAKERNRREEKEGCFEKVSKRVMDRRNDGGCVRETRKLVRRISRRNEAARGGAKYRAIDFTARRLAR